MASQVEIDRLNRFGFEDTPVVDGGVCERCARCFTAEFSRSATLRYQDRNVLVCLAEDDEPMLVAPDEWHSTDECFEVCEP